MDTEAELNWLGRPMGCNGEGAEILAWDGRLDNRDDLTLVLKDRLRECAGDVAIVQATYERWGIGGLARLIGDWSVVIRDHASRAIVLASDFAGVRPLYYRVQQERVFWSSRLQSILDASESRELDQEYIHGFLLWGGCPNRTPYKGIYSVPPGHAVRITSDCIKAERFWELPTGYTIRYRTEGEYEEHLRVLFREAVAVRLQTKAPVLAELSGGLDSSSVVSMAKHLMLGGVTKAKRLTGVSYLWKDSLDEPFVREVETSCGIDGIHISTHDVPLISEAQVGNAAPETFQPLRSRVAGVARQLGARTVLTGQGGDLLMGNWFDDSLQVAALLRDCRVGEACREALAWSKILHLPIYSVLWRGFRAALPSWLTPDAIYAISDGSFMPKSAETSLLPSRIGQANLRDSRCFFSDVWMQAPPERRKHFRQFSTLLELRTFQAPESLQDLDYTHPFVHRPLVEFLLAVPASVLCRPGEPRKLMRSTLSHLWPVKLRKRRSKSLFNAPWQEALRPLARVLLRSKRFHVVDHGFADRDSLISRLRSLAVGLDCNEAQLRQIIVLELWLRCRADGDVRGPAVRAA